MSDEFTQLPELEEQMAHVLENFEPLLRGIAAVARGEEQFRADIEEALPALEENGWMLHTAVQRIWAGERNLANLMAGLDMQDSFLISRILELINLPTVAEVLASLPPELRQALEAEDLDTANEILDELPVAEAQAIVRQLLDSGIVSAPDPVPVEADADDSLPEAIVAALEAEDVPALEAALAQLPPEMAQAVLDRLEEAGIVTVRGGRGPAAGQVAGAPAPSAGYELEPLVYAIAAVAAGDERPRAKVETLLPELTQLGWDITAAVEDIWAGERDVVVLTAGLDPDSAELVLRVLELLD